MKKEKRSKNTIAYQAEKVSFRECIGIFKNIQMPWVMMVVSLVLTVTSAYASLHMATFSGEMVDASGQLPVSALVTYVLATVAYVVLYAGGLLMMHLASERINFGIRKKLWKKIIYTKQNCYDKDGGETLVSRVTSDCDFACNFFTNIVGIISLLASAAIYLVEMYKLNVKMTSYVLLFIPVSLLIGWGYTLLRFLVAQKTQAMLAESTNYLVERTKDLPLIKTSNAQQQEIATGRKYFEEQYKMQVKVGLVAALHTAIDNFLGILAIAIPFVVGAAFVQQGLLTVGVIVAFNGLFGQAKITFSSLILYTGNMKEANGALARVTKVFELPEEETKKGQDLEKSENQDVVLENIDFGYTDKLIMKQFSCRIPRNKVTAVIGTNGSGKTTMFKLIERLYEPSAGTVCFGKKNVEEYSLHSWRRKFTMVAQGSPMMEGTIRENLCYGCDREISDEELKKAAKLTHVADFVEQLPEGYDTHVAAGGSNFSGGQKQCIAITRAMLRSGDYLLLDEATSNLDAKKEREVMEAMQALMKGRTTLIIAHSLATIKDADHVLVINQGELEASGSPAEILAQTDNYLAKVMGRKVAMS